MPVVDRVEAPKIPADLETLRCSLQVCTVMRQMMTKEIAKAQTV